MLRVFFLILILTSCSSMKKKDVHLNPFTTDGCTLYPNGTWLHCCIVHDMAYWVGGDVKEREVADQELGQCVASVSSKANGERMIGGVHFGGRPNNVLPWAWGYGWNSNLGYSSIKGEKLHEVEGQLSSIIPAIREFDGQLSKVQATYILKSYQELLQRTAEKISQEK